MTSASFDWPLDATETIHHHRELQKRNKNVYDEDDDDDSNDDGELIVEPFSLKLNRLAEEYSEHDHPNDLQSEKLVNKISFVPIIVSSSYHSNEHAITRAAAPATPRLASEQSIMTTCDHQQCDLHQESEDMAKRSSSVNSRQVASDDSYLGVDCISSRLIAMNQLQPINPIRKVTSVTLVTKCRHHRTKTKCSSLAARGKNFSKNIYQRLTATAATTTASTSCTTLKRNQDLLSWPIRWTLIQIALIYIIFTSNSLKIAQASTTTTNYWPLIHQHRYQQLFFTGRMQQSAEDNDGQQQQQKQQQQPQLQLHHHHHHQHRLASPSIRHQSSPNSAAAVAAAAAAITATANAAKARKSQSHNLMIGQNFDNFSSIIPYSMVQDVDYGTMPEDPLINEQSSDLTGASGSASNNNNNNLDDQQQHQADSTEFKISDNIGNSELDSLSPGPSSTQLEHSRRQQQQQQQQQQLQQLATAITKMSTQHKVTASDRALLPLDTNRLALPQMQQIKARFNQGCVGGTKCQFFAFCWMSGGSLGASCGLLMTCCVTPSRQEIQPGFYGPVVNDPYCGRSTSKINRIVGGTDASFGQFPWQAFVQVGGSRCGGALISSRHVVTAGHCVARSQHSPSSIKVTLGDYILNSDIESIPHEVYSVVEVLLHPNFRFTPQADRYDVAVLELDRAASYKDNIKPICLPQKDATFVGRVAYVAGWGALQAGSKLRPKVLQHVAVPVIENNVCESWHRRKGIDIRIYDEMMCAGYELGQRDACQGDSGGPLMLNQFGVWYLVGIVSAGYSCAKQYQPGIYHRVSSSSDWISSNVYQQGNS